MKLSKKGEYALRALLALTYASKANNGKSLHLKDISQSEEIPLKFLEHIMSELKRGGWVKSQKGRGGGYVLSRAGREIKLGEVIRWIDGPLSPIGSVEEIQALVRKRNRASGLYSILLDVRNAVAEILDHTSLEDLYKKTTELTGIHHRSGMYYI